MQQSKPYLATHLRTVHQTAIALSMVDHCIADEQHLERDKGFEEKYVEN